MNNCSSKLSQRAGIICSRLVTAFVALGLCGSPFAAQLGEDCVRIDPHLYEVVDDDQGYLVAHRGVRLLLFNKENEAHRALDILRHYDMNLACYVGRPHPPLSYFLTDGGAPAGAKAGEDCVPIDREQLIVGRVEDGWTVFQADRPWIDFGSSRNQAELALAVILQHEFDYQCFIGRPEPSFSYLRKD